MSDIKKMLEFLANKAGEQEEKTKEVVVRPNVDVFGTKLPIMSASIMTGKIRK